MLIRDSGPVSVSPAARALLDAALELPDGATFLAEAAVTQPDAFLALVGEALLDDDRDDIRSAKGA